MQTKEDEPLKEEAAKRPDWRSDSATPRAGGGNHTLPASEEDQLPGEDEAGGRSPLTTIAPPD